LADKNQDLQRLVDELKRDLSTANAAIFEHTKSAQDKDIAISALQSQMAQKDDQAKMATKKIAKMSASLKEKDKNDLQMQARVAELETTITNMAEDISKQQSLLADSMGAHLDTNATLDRVKAERVTDRMVSETRIDQIKASEEQVVSMLLAWLSYSTSRFALAVNDKAACGTELRMFVSKLVKTLTSLPETSSEEIRQSIETGVLKCAGCARPVIASLPLLKALDMLIEKAKTKSAGLSLDQWLSVRDRFVDRLQDTILSGLNSSSRKHASDLLPESILENLDELLVTADLLGLDKQVLRQPLTGWLQHLFYHIETDSTEIDFVLLSRKTLTSSLKGLYQF
jgi:hypothetical protein